MGVWEFIYESIAGKDSNDVLEILDIDLQCRTVHVATLLIQSNSCTIHTLKHTHFNI